ncbi:NAD(P)-dependent oxidoreductase [Rickettsia endosymbiont of Culicoides newsteadi]|uniref:NAD(P)-dependent oxidoreductase n=1 Tax=Rickettsia endosymbiont of Culicoides newsteadi TaxID=1961830 RepID=UPI000B9B0282|nr:NAD(P)-dependent oxidoreductase [Rickettsia endosymbiont of Culicoides newsteadi]OZG32515.1 hypothetical protein RiCNE_00720 [Rickettsia endosymbiont of Culicoides newsteadi]
MSNTEHKQKILPVLQTIVDRLKVCKDINLTDVTFVCIQHLLFTTIDLIKSLIMLGAKPSNIHIMGKIYSTCPEVVEQIIKLGVIHYHCTQPQQLGNFNDCFNKDIANMWNKVSNTLINTKSNNIIILDDGSKCITNIPKSLSDNYTVFAVEQTSSGIAHIKKTNITVPVVNVAFSAAKQLLESPMIARAVEIKLDKFLSLRSSGLTSGVVGLGVIGRAVVQKLLSFNHKVIVYDKIKEKCNFINSVKVANSTQLLFQEADYIFGCTGEDISISININEIQGIKNLISCSSQDIEFQSLLKIIQNNYPNMISDVLSNLCLPLDNGIIKIYRGGYPINLDNSGESVPAQDIQLTRGLLLGGIIQAIFQLIQEPKLESKQYMLDPKIQKLIVQELMINRLSQISDESLVMNFLDEEWIKNNSIGCSTKKPIIFPESLFNVT